MKKGCLFFSVVTLLIFSIGGFFGYRYYKKYFGNNVEKEGFVLIPHHSSYKQILDSIAPFVKNQDNFASIADDKNLKENFKAGRYEIKSGMNNREIANMIIAGNQTPNSFRIKDFDDVYQMIGRVTKKTEIDSLKFANQLNEIAISKGYKNAEDLKKYIDNLGTKQDQTVKILQETVEKLSISTQAQVGATIDNAKLNAGLSATISDQLQNSNNESYVLDYNITSIFGQRQTFNITPKNYLN